MCPPGKMGHHCEQGKVDGNTEIVCGEVEVVRSKKKNHIGRDFTVLIR